MPAPWDRRPKESLEAYAAFLRYRDLGADRTLERVSRDHTEATPETNLRKIKGWSARHAWVERCRQWDNHLQTARDREAAKRAAELERRRLRELDEVWTDAMALRAKVRDMLKVPHLKATTERTETTQDGKTIINHVTFEPARWAFRDVATMAKAAAELAAAVLHAHGQDTAALSDAETRGIADASTRGRADDADAGGPAVDPGGS